VIDTDKIRAAMPGYKEAVACGDMQTRLEDAVIALCDKIDELQKKNTAIRNEVAKFTTAMRWMEWSK